MNYLRTGQFFGQTDKTIRCDGLTMTDTQYTVEYVDWHYHENPYFTFIVDGSIIEGSKRETHHCSTGTLLFHNWQEPHYNIKPEGRTRGFQLETKAEWFDNFDLDLNNLPGYINIKQPPVKLLFHNIYKETKLSGAESTLAIEGLLLEVLQVLGNLKIVTERKAPFWVKRIDEIFRENFSENLTLKELAKELNLHPVYLCRTFSKFFGCGFGEYVRKIHIEKSLTLLPDKRFSLTEIAFVCGFADQSHFIRCFKALMGLSPKDYRKTVLK